MKKHLVKAFGLNRPRTGGNQKPSKVGTPVPKMPPISKEPRPPKVGVRTGGNSKPVKIPGSRTRDLEFDKLSRIKNPKLRARIQRP